MTLLLGILDWKSDNLKTIGSTFLHIATDVNISKVQNSYLHNCYNNGND